MKLPLWCPVLLHHDTRSVPKVSWFELFFDLQYVPVVYKLGLYLKDNPGWDGIGVTFIIFVCFWAIRLHCNMIFGRFSNDDVFGKLIYFVTQAGILNMAAHIDKGLNDENDRYHFAGAIIVVKMVEVIYYSKCAWYVPHARAHVAVNTVGLVVSLILNIPALFEGDRDVSLVYYGIGTAAELVAQVFAELVDYLYVPVCVDHCAERTGLLVILAFGEAALGLILTPGQTDWEHNVILLFCFTHVFCLSLLYFDSQPLSEKKHAVHRSKVRGVLYTYLHLFITFSVYVVGVSVAFMLKAGTMKTAYARMLSVSTGLTATMFYVCRALHKKPRWPKPVGWFRNVSRICICALMLMCGEFIEEQITLIAVEMSLVIVLNMVDTLVFSRVQKESQLSIPRIPVFDHGNSTATGSVADEMEDDDDDDSVDGNMFHAAAPIPPLSVIVPSELSDRKNDGDAPQNNNAVSNDPFELELVVPSGSQQRRSSRSNSACPSPRAGGALLPRLGSGLKSPMSRNRSGSNLPSPRASSQQNSGLRVETMEGTVYISPQVLHRQISQLKESKQNSSDFSYVPPKRRVSDLPTHRGTTHHANRDDRHQNGTAEKDDVPPVPEAPRRRWSELKRVPHQGHEALTGSYGHVVVDAELPHYDVTLGLSPTHRKDNQTVREALRRSSSYQKPRLDQTQAPQPSPAPAAPFKSIFSPGELSDDDDNDNINNNINNNGHPDDPPLDTKNKQRTGSTATGREHLEGLLVPDSSMILVPDAHVLETFSGVFSPSPPPPN
eukprot:PhM_4_TR10159/c0_g1_i1/m.7804